MIKLLLTSLLAAFSFTCLTSCIPTIIARTATGASVATDRRSTGAIVDDRTIEVKALQKVGDQPFYKQTHVSAISYNARLILIGQVPSAYDAETLVTAMQTIPKVRQVVNELEVGPPIGFTTRSSDTLITSKVKSALLAEKNLNSNAFKVVTENGVVFLIGLVTYEEGNKASEVTRQIGGVKKVTRVFEFTTQP